MNIAKPAPLGPLAAGRAACGAMVLTAVVTATDDGPVLCPFRRCTGGYCPGCGGTRAARRLAVGDITGAWQHHPWVVIAAVQLLVVGAVVASGVFASRRTRWRAALIGLATINAVVAIAIWTMRLRVGSIPAGWL